MATFYLYVSANNLVLFEKKSLEQHELHVTEIEIQQKRILLHLKNILKNIEYQILFTIFRDSGDLSLCIICIIYMIIDNTI